MATALYLQAQKPNARIYLVGTQSLEVEFEEYGFQLVDKNPDFAVLGFDTTLTYRKIQKLTEYISEGIPYIATHPDINCPTPEGDIPDIGAMMAMVKASTGKEADQIIGKPHAPMMEVVSNLTGFNADQITMVGDRLYTDIALGRWGVRTVLVLSGETKREDLPGRYHPPDLVCENLAELLAILRGV
jgi:HAD superfamily hydrolase (TIGR01450 family)